MLRDFTATITGLSTNPTYGATAEDGVALSADTSNFSGRTPCVITYQWKTVESGAISGATRRIFTPNAAQYDGEALYCSITPDGYPSKDTEMSVIRFAPPAARGNPGEQFWDTGTGVQFIDMSYYVSGAALIWVVAGQGASICPMTGLLTVLTDSQAIGAQATVTAANSGGAVTVAFTFHIEDFAAGPGPDLSVPTLDDLTDIIRLAVDEECVVYWRRDRVGANLDPAQMVAGGGFDSGFFAVTAGANTANITFAAGNDGPQEISFVAIVLANEPALVRTVTIEVNTDSSRRNTGLPASGSADVDLVEKFDVPDNTVMASSDVVANARRGTGQAEIRTLVGLIPVSNSATVTDNGVTFYFDKRMPVGQFVDGSYFVVSDEAFEIKSITPVSQTLNGQTAHGAMQDPYFGSNGLQGFDGFIGAGTGGNIAAANITYSAAANVDPNISGNISISLGEETTILKSVRLSSVTDANQWQTVEKYVPLTVISAIPLVGAIRPAFCATTKTIYNYNNVDFSVLRSVTLPASFPRTEAQVLATTPPAPYRIGGDAEQARRLRVDADLGVAPNNYSGDFCEPYAQLCMTLHKSGLSTVYRDTIAKRVLLYGIDYLGFQSRGGELTAGAGQGGGVLSFLYYTAFLLQDASLLTQVQAIDVDATFLVKWITATEVGQPPRFSVDTYGQPFLNEQVGQPHMIPDEFTSHFSGRYMIQAAQHAFPEVTAVMLLQNGPGGEKGHEALLDGSTVNDTADRRSASLAFIDRARTFLPQVMNTRVIEDWDRDMYDLAQPLAGYTAWTGRPDQVPHGDHPNYNDGWFSVGGASGEIDWDITGLDYATETVTSIEVRHSLDGRQWIATSGVDVTGTLTGLMGSVAHFCGIRQVSSSGVGAWSANYQLFTSGSEVEKWTPTGSGSGSPTNTTAPVLLQRKYPMWTHWEEWEPTSATLGKDDPLELAAGAGYWSGAAITGFTYEWQRSDNGVSGWAAISGATLYNFTRTATDTGKFLRCEVTATNASGSTAAFTNVVEMPALTSYAAGTLIDTEFSYSFAIDHEDLLVTLTGSNCTAQHLPDLSYGNFENPVFGKIPNVTRGAICGEKTAGTPEMTMNIGNLDSTETYRVQANIVQGIDKSGAKGGKVDWAPSPLRVDIRRVSDSSSQIGGYNSYADPRDENIPLIVRFDEIFSPATTTDYEIYLANWTGIGSDKGGDLIVSDLRISTV